MVDYKEMALELIMYMRMPGKMRQKSLSGVQSDIFVLMYIDYHGDVLPKDISTAMEISTARVTVALNELEEEGLITREIDPGDRRRIIVKITDKGKGVALEERDTVLNRITTFLSELGEKDAKEYIRLMGRIAEIERKNGW